MFIQNWHQKHKGAKMITVPKLICKNLKTNKLKKGSKTDFETIVVPELPDKYKVHKGIDTICAFSGILITEGVLVSDIVTDATNQPHETFKYNSDYVDIYTARLFKWVIGGAIGNLYADDTGFGDKPMVSRDSAINGKRACWIDLVRNLSIGTKTAAIFTEESKRRLWAFSTIGVVGDNWQVYLNTSDYSGNIIINHCKLLELLSFMEKLYELGFNKRHFREGLVDYKFIKKQDLKLSKIMDYEQRISEWRNTNEFKLAVFIIQPK
jgi:hypothetical protein